MKNIIEIKNLTKYYGGLKAVDNISFCVREGQSFSFLGSNGAGKSTTINIICGIIDKDFGEILFEGIDIKHKIENHKKNIGIVFQHSTLDKNLTVYENLKYKASLYEINEKEIMERITYLAKTLDFEYILNKSVTKLSGGELRRIDIARALIHNPKILILDEPTTGLDPQTRQIVWKFLNKLKEERSLTIFLTTHYMEEANDTDYVVILHKGKIVAEDTPVNLKNKYAKDLIKIYNLEDNKKAVEFFKAKGYNCVNKKEYIQIEIKDTNSVKNLIINYSQYFNDFEVVKGKMDDVFLRVTGKILEKNDV